MFKRADKVFCDKCKNEKFKGNLTKKVKHDIL